MTPLEVKAGKARPRALGKKKQSEADVMTFEGKVRFGRLCFLTGVEEQVNKF